MQYDKYGDPVVTAPSSLPAKTRKAFWVLLLCQVICIILNLCILFISTLNLYLCFIVAPLYLFLFITYQKGISTHRETSSVPNIFRVCSIISPVIYIITAVLAIFGGM